MVQRSDANYIFIDYPVGPEGLQVVVEFDVLFYYSFTHTLGFFEVSVLSSTFDNCMRMT